MMQVTRTDPFAFPLSRAIAVSSSWSPFFLREIHTVVYVVCDCFGFWQRDSAGLATQNNELKFRLHAMEQQAQLRDALNEALTTEVQRLKLATAELGDSCSSSSLAQQIQLNAQNQMFQLQQQQATQIPFYQLQQSQQNGAAKNNESKEWFQRHFGLVHGKRILV
jgi:hypothetical protein